MEKLSNQLTHSLYPPQLPSQHHTHIFASIMAQWSCLQNLGLKIKYCSFFFFFQLSKTFHKGWPQITFPLFSISSIYPMLNQSLLLGVTWNVSLLSLCHTCLIALKLRSNHNFQLWAQQAIKASKAFVNLPASEGTENGSACHVMLWANPTEAVSSLPGWQKTAVNADYDPVMGVSLHRGRRSGGAELLPPQGEP